MSDESLIMHIVPLAVTSKSRPSLADPDLIQAQRPSCCTQWRACRRSQTRRPAMRRKHHGGYASCTRRREAKRSASDIAARLVLDGPTLYSSTSGNQIGRNHQPSGRSLELLLTDRTPSAMNHPVSIPSCCHEMLESVIPPQFAHRKGQVRQLIRRILPSPAL